ncbi:MAG: iron ABC transporter permease [Clostridia bacterium]|nr:iron ABC transporter permease [Clostridia bacterium]
MERRKQRVRITWMFAMLSFALLVSAVLNIALGSVQIPLRDIAEVLLRRNDNRMYEDIIWQIRLPRLVMAAVLGGGLAVSGFLLQTFFGNPIAGPFVLGISSGARLAVALTMIVFLDRMQAASSWVLVFSAMIGSLACMGFILLLANRLKHMSTLLVAGIMIGYICSAVTDFIVTFASESDIVNLRGWSLGSFSGMNWENIRAASAIIGTGFALSLLMSKPMGAYQLGEAYARSVGVNIRWFRIALILLSGALSACVAAFAGPISFVGIAVPYLIRRLFNTSRPLIVIPAAFLGGAVFCMGCDLIARTAFVPTELNVSTVTSVFGAPVVIVMMLRRRKAG